MTIETTPFAETWEKGTVFGREWKNRIASIDWGRMSDNDRTICRSSFKAGWYARDDIETHDGPAKAILKEIFGELEYDRTNCGLLREKVKSFLENNT